MEVFKRENRPGAYFNQKFKFYIILLSNLLKFCDKLARIIPKYKSFQKE